MVESNGEIGSVLLDHWNKATDILVNSLVGVCRDVSGVEMEVIKVSVSFFILSISFRYIHLKEEYTTT